MYLPLRFLEQIDNYIQISNNNSMRGKVNELSIKCITDIMDRDIDFIFDTYSYCKDFVSGYRSKIKQSVIDRWANIVLHYTTNTMLMCTLDEDFINLVMLTHIRNEWRQRKIVYKVSSNLQETLIGMKLNKLVGIDCVANLPSDYFYIDYSDGKGFYGNNKGCMIACNKSKKAISIICILLLDNIRVNTIIMSIGVDLAGADSNTSVFMTADDTSEEVVISVEDETGTFREREFKTFILNFFTYMYAVNKDVEVTERASKLINRPSEAKLKEPTNKYKEIEDYNVGFRYVKKPVSKVKYVYEDGYEHKHIGVGKCTHYRQAHWHSYWVGKGKDKKIVVKWIEGTMVNGKVAKNVTIKEV